MKTSKKPLHVAEQSMLLVSILFAQKNIDDILGFLPQEQIHRMTPAKCRFLGLEHSERVTKIIFELRRLLLVSKRRTDWIHHTWIDESLAQEPGYLAPIVKKLLVQPDLKNSSIIPNGIILHSFLNQFPTTQKKIAIFDPILMRLQSIKDSDHELILAGIGSQVLDMLLKSAEVKRLAKFISVFSRYDKNKLVIPDKTKNIFTNTKLRLIIISYIVMLKKHKTQSLEVELGIFMLACYLSTHNASWQTTISLIFEKSFGLKLNKAIKKIGNNGLKSLEHELVRELLILFIDNIS